MSDVQMDAQQTLNALINLYYAAFEWRPNGFAAP